MLCRTRLPPARIAPKIVNTPSLTSWFTFATVRCQRRSKIAHSLAGENVTPYGG